MKCNENNFIENMRHKEEDAINYVIDQYFPIVKGTVKKVLYRFGAEEVIEECVNDVFLSAWNHIDQFKGDNALEFKKWIYKIAKFKAIDQYRKFAKSKEVLLEDWQEEVGLSTEDIFISKDDEKNLISLINTMDPPDRFIFIMKFFWGEKSDSIAKKLGLTQAAVDNRIYRGRQKLIQRMEVI